MSAWQGCHDGLACRSLSPMHNMPMMQPPFRLANAVMAVSAAIGQHSSCFNLVAVIQL